MDFQRVQRELGLNIDVPEIEELINPEVDEKYIELINAAKQLKKNSNFKLLKNHLQELFLSSIHDYPPTQEGMTKAFADMHFRRGLNLFFQQIDNAE